MTGEDSGKGKKMAIKREYRDRLFRFVFGNEAYRENALALYNALNGTEYEDPEELEFTTIEDVIYMGMKNDISFIIDGEMSLYEHQSTYNPNMPVRGLMYFGKLYHKYVTEKKLNLYGKKLEQLPTPRYVIFYNGDEWQGEEETLRLTDAFAYPERSCLEVTATMYNINLDKGNEILKRCKALNDYARFIQRVKDNIRKGKEKEEAVKEAVDYCITEEILDPILRKNKSEVTEMYLTEYNEEETLQQ